MAEVLELFVSIPNDPACDPANNLSSDFSERRNALRNLDEVLHEVVLVDGAGKEAKQWLVTNISKLALEDAEVQRRKLTRLLPRFGKGGSVGPAQKEICCQLLRLICERMGAKVCELLGQAPGVVERFFKGDPSRIRLWFAHFSMSGMAEFQYGARALARYALANRSEVWDLLVWGGKHPQAPISVAQRPHYFCELEVEPTVRNLLDRCPAFWQSDSFLESIQGGDILQLDLGYFSQALWEEWLLGGSLGSSIDRLLDRYLAEESFQVVSQALLPLAESQALLRLLNQILPRPSPQDFQVSSRRGSTEPPDGRKGLPGGPARGLGGAPGVPLGVDAGVRDLQSAVFGLVAWGSLDDAVLAGALALSRLQTLKMLQEEEEHEDAWQEVQGLVKRLSGPGSGQARAAMLESTQAQSEEKGLKMLLLEAWALFCRLHLLSKKGLQSLEAVFALNGISFERVSVPEPVLEDYQRIGKKESREKRAKGKKGRKGKKEKKAKEKKGDKGQGRKHKRRRLEEGWEGGWPGGEGSSGDEGLGWGEAMGVTWELRHESWGVLKCQLSEVPEVLSQLCFRQWMLAFLQRSRQ